MVKKIAVITTALLSVGGIAWAQATSGTTSASAAELKKEIAPKFSASLANWSVANMKDTNERRGLAESLNWLEVGYNTSEKTKIGLRQYFSYNFAAPGSSNENVRQALADRKAPGDNTPDQDLGKPYGQKNPNMENLTAFVNTSAESIAGSREIPVVVRLDLPTSDRYINDGLNGRLYAVADTRWDIAGPLNAGFQVIPYAYFKNSDSVAHEGVPNYRLISQGVVAYSLSNVEIGQLVGADTKLRSDGSKLRETAEFETYVDWSVMKNLGLYFSVANSYPILNVAENRSRTDGIYLQEETSYNLITTLRF